MSNVMMHRKKGMFQNVDIQIKLLELGRQRLETCFFPMDHRTCPNKFIIYYFRSIIVYHGMFLVHMFKYHQIQQDGIKQIFNLIKTIHFMFLHIQMLVYQKVLI